MRFVPEVADSAQVFAPFATDAVVLTLVRIDDGTWRAWGLGPGIRPAREVLGQEAADAAQFRIGGGTALALTWLTELATADPPVELIWGTLDDPLRLAMTQSWLLNSEHMSIDDTERDEIADSLSAVDGRHPMFADMYQDLLQRLRHVYSDTDGNPV